MINRVLITVIKPEHQRYKTVGDWQATYDGTLNIFVSETGDWRQNMLIGIHELVESVLATNTGKTTQQVDSFDFRHQDDEDPGSLTQCPIYNEHMIAYGIEMILAQQMSIDWRKYEKDLDATCEKSPEGKLE